ncbi:MAG: hypothetical protein ABIN24_01310 [Dyadobacter sp.]
MKIKLYRHIFYYFALMLLASCNNVKDLQPGGPVEIPEAVASVLTNAYPNAKDISLKTVTTDKLWEARFSSDGLLYYVALNTNRVLRAYKLLGATVPDSLQNTFSTLSIKGGTFSDFRQEDFAMDLPYYTAKYVLKGTPYNVQWQPSSMEKTPSGKHIYYLVVRPYFKFEYYIFSGEHELGTIVPPAINNYIATLNLNLYQATGYVSDANNVSHFIASNTMANSQVNLFFDESNNLAVDYSAPNNQVFSSLSSFPTSVAKFVDNYEFVSRMQFNNGVEKKTVATAPFVMFFNREITQQYSDNETLQIWLDKNGSMVDFLYTVGLYI